MTRTRSLALSAATVLALLASLASSLPAKAESGQAPLRPVTLSFDPTLPLSNRPVDAISLTIDGVSFVASNNSELGHAQHALNRRHDPGASTRRTVTLGTAMWWVIARR